MIDHNTSKSLDDQIKEERLKDVAAGTGRKARFARVTLKRKEQKDTNFCPEGHEYTDENTYLNGAGRRTCMQCLRNRRIYPDKASDRLKSHGREVINLKPNE